MAGSAQKNVIYNLRKVFDKMFSYQLLKIPVRFLIIFFTICTFLFIACNDTDNSVSTIYSSSRLLSEITIEEESFNPKLNWVGGYVSILGVNNGTSAALDESLIWIIYNKDDGLSYPVEFGTVPNGAEDLTDLYGGERLESLIEDSSYTFWLMKYDAWTQISDQKNKILFEDTTSTGSSVEIRGDSIFIGPMAYTKVFRALDVYINIKNIRSVGKLATLTVEQPTTSNNPKVSWKIKQADVTDSLVAALGIVEGQTYNPNKIQWEVWSVDSSSGSKEYGTHNVAKSPIITGQDFEDMVVFADYPASGLSRNKDYQFWIANNNWDGEGRTRVTNYYAYITFRTW